ncbi:hypothetical protein [Pelagicoccus sp. SDUM812003]|uniref:hypothetical protein n=1 Tax=Pelagicoccus sp. SDUM812003 TaxID=3041267 RepID=UPI0028110F30|nr:hypothetical protein [Pelagicoccus sp. SDUM812003]
MGCGGFIELVEEERNGRRINDAEAQVSYNLTPGTYPNKTDLDRISKASEPIREIFKKEIIRGNRLSETSEGWPSKGVTIWLRNGFLKDHRTKSVEFRRLNDPHYWKDEYCDPETGDLIVSKFK